MKLDYEVLIDRPVEVVWDYANNPDHLRLWLNDFVRREQLTGVDGVPQVGDTANVTYAQGKSEFVMREQVTAADPPNRLVLSMTSKQMDMEIVNTFEAAGPNQTKLFAGAEFTRLNLMMKAIFAVTPKKKMLADHESQINKLKTLIEAS